MSVQPSKGTLQDVKRAIRVLDTIADRIGDEWDDYEYDAVASARSALAAWVSEREKMTLWRLARIAKEDA